MVSFLTRTSKSCSPARSAPLLARGGCGRPESERRTLPCTPPLRFAGDSTWLDQGSERETYLGSGSGVNEGDAIGAFKSWIKAGVGRYLSWKNRPIHDKLWTIISDDVLGTVQKRIPDLEQRRTAFSAPGDAPSTHVYASDDGAFEGRISGYRGGKADWVSTSIFFYDKLGFGNMRFNAWSDRSTRAPHLCIELCVILDVSPFPPLATGTIRLITLHIRDRSATLSASVDAHGFLNPSPVNNPPP